MMSFTFAQPEWFSLFLILLPVYYKKVLKNTSYTAIVVPSLAHFKSVYKSSSSWHLLPKTLRFLALSAMIIAMARPQLVSGESKKATEGIDMILVVDTSSSMQALDFSIDGKRRDRLTVVKKVLMEFIDKRPNDRMGLIVFGSEAFVQAPLTLDHEVLKLFLDQLKIGMAGDHTAIGDSIGLAAARLDDIKAKAKVMILLTDGEQTAGRLSPDQAANAALALKQKIYTIGIGSKGKVPFPTQFGIQYAESNFDETALKHIASITGGAYFRATDTESLREIYGQIDQLEKTKSEEKIYRHYDELYGVFLWPALGLILLELTLLLTRLRKIPA